EVAERENHVASIAPWCAPEEQPRERRATRRRPSWPTELEQMKERVGPRPEARPGRGPHETDEDGFPRRQRVAGHLGVEQRLENHGERAHPQERWTMRDGNAGTAEPVAGPQPPAAQDRS